LVRVRRQRGVLLPRYLDAKARESLLPVAEALIEIFRASIGATRSELDAAQDSVTHAPRYRIVVAGLRKLLLDRCELALTEGIEPSVVRRAVFAQAAQQHRGLELRESFDRSRSLSAAAEELAMTTDAIEERLFADLKGCEALLSFKELSAQDLLDRYNVALAQGVLLRASRVIVTLDGESPGNVRQLFRAARFHGLLHRVTRSNNGYRIELDGPFSLFSAVQKYGLKLAIFLPAVLRCDHWTLHADVLWGKAREPMRFELSPERGLVPTTARITGVSPEVDALVTKFRRLRCDWDVEPNEEIVALPGEAVCVPDLVFANRSTGEQVFLEAFGFWSRDAVWSRIETIQRGFDARIILAVGKQLRVSEQVLEDDAAGQLYVYKTTMSARAVLGMLNAR